MKKDKKKLIVMLLIIVVILLLTLITLMTNFGKESSEINIISKDTLKNGDTISITLKDSNGNSIADQKVDIIIENEKNQQVTTDEMGNGVLQLNRISDGQYTVKVIYNGNDKYSKSETTQSLTISDQATSLSNNESSSSDKTESIMSEDGYSYKTGYGPDYDCLGVSREEAAAKGWHYIPGMDDEGNDMGAYVPYDYNAGCYHT